ncbi:non-ribosomal peptide synthetase [Streptomyces globosus]|uniref:non-ribosomal peptide synthetase n=1 Tax=Streptomyces globosus TaxID=68209 RepID=UPI0037F5FAC1
MSPTERLYLAAGQPRGGMALRIVVEGDGLPDPDRLRAAVARAAETCPGSRLVRSGPLWVAGGPPPPVVHAPPAAGPFDVSDPHTARLLTDRSGPADRPGCGLLVVPGAGGARTTLVFSASHALMDGHGALTWVREVFRALRGEAARPAADPSTDLGVLHRLAAGPGGRLRRRPAPLPGRRSPLGPAAAAGTPSRTLWLRRTLPGRHPALTARLAQALADTARLDTRAMVPVDLRRHLPHLAAATGNLTLPVFLDLRPGEDWAAAHTRLLTALAAGGELAAGFEAGLVGRLPRPAVAALLRAAQAAAERSDRHLASAVVSHLGRLDTGELSGGGFTAGTAYALPVHAPLVPLSFAVAETADATEITLGVRAADPSLPRRATAFLDSVLDALLAGGAGVRTGAPSAPTARSGPAAADSAAVAGERGLLPPAHTPAPSVPSVPSVPADATVVDLFRAQAARTPAAVALDGPAGPVTYAELDRRSDAVAAELVRRGTARRDLVGLVVDRTPEGVAALWGILKAGAAYVPLDPAHPGPRVRGVLASCGARLTLTRRHLVAGLAEFVPGELLAVDDVPTPAQPPDTPAAAAATAPAPDDLAYVMHTSGSTGRPKGVLIEHRGLAAFVRWMTDLCRVGEGTRFGFASSYAFDISCFPLFLPLSAGGTAVLAPDAPSPAVLRALVGEHRADTLALTPSHLALLDGDGGGPLRTLLLGGEELTPAAVRSAYAAFGPGCRLINGYGPTEATVACLAHVVDDTETGPSLPLGTPGPGLRVDLVAEDGTPIGTGPDETGRVGEIVVHGVQVARGYHRPEQAPAEPDGPGTPFATGPDGVRSYRTGDLGRRLPGGGIAFAGRADGQVKVAGHRIEPAEITAALEAHPGVARAAVTPRRRPGARGPVLCAYAVPTQGTAATVPSATGPAALGTAAAGPADSGSAVTAPEATGSAASGGAGTGLAHDRPVDAAAGAPMSSGGAPSAEELRAHLAGILPRHLVPAHVLLVAALPTTVSGKTDFDALPDPFAGTAPPPAGPGVPHEPADTDPGGSRTALRARVARHWATVLGVDASVLSADSDFQALGGDSLALVEMLSAVSADLLTPDQARRLTEDLTFLVRDLTLGRVCDRLTAVREGTTA